MRLARLYLVLLLLLFATLRLVAGSDIEVIQVDRKTMSATPSPEESASIFTIDPELNVAFPAFGGGAAEAINKRLARFNRLPRDEKATQIMGGMLRYGPYAMFLLLPAFAPLLKALYFGPVIGPRRGQGFTASISSSPRTITRHCFFLALRWCWSQTGL